MSQRTFVTQCWLDASPAIDPFGNEEGESNTRFKLIAKDGIRPTDSRVMRFTASRAPIINATKVPIEIMGEQLKEFTTKRLVPTEHFVVEAPIGKKVKHMFNSFVADKKSGAMMIYGAQKYLLLHQLGHFVRRLLEWT